MSKITMVGAGNVGATAVQHIAQKELCEELVMIDVVEGLPQGKGLDMWESAPLCGSDTHVEGTNDMKAMKDSDLVLITAGLARKPGMSRSDLLDKNAEIVGGIVEHIVRHAPKAIIMVVTNPLDVMTYLAYRVSGFARERVFGMAGVLDSARLCSFVAMELGVSVKDTQALVLGGHGDSMVPLPRYTTVAGIPITQLMDQAAIDRILDRTRKAGGEIVALLKTGSAYYSPGASLAEMVEAVVKNKRRVLPCAAILQGEYGLKDVCAGVPVLLGQKGIEKIVEVKLEPSEIETLRKSAEDVKQDIARLKLP
ncbi:MAG: malate dehydrogenase [Candidatus Abyssobacteria bacterium SURF_17]|uniref:Malate dehydrogenase n=1 Tax=Candidatus Abyssobacteria bacterium SURF_17 TaxID=2093361 RepID=A0A419EMX5_9BACT|nr:MAG: malate dehydrogenase [Candidatus Abyssubacteria bacterium SURF_17]